MSPPAGKSFDRLAEPYEALERAAFGGLLETARFEFLGELHGCRRVLLLGDGDGRLLARLVGLAPQATIISVDQSAAMLAKAQRRLRPEDLSRVKFYHADVLVADLGGERLDAIVTAFFLDCFSQPEAEQVVQQMDKLMAPSALWLEVDFGLPARGWRRWYAQGWLKLMYTFFRWRTGITAKALPDLQSTFHNLGWQLMKCQTYRAGFVYSRLYQKNRQG